MTLLDIPNRATSLLLPPKPEWEPLYWTPPQPGNKYSRGADVYDFSKHFLTATRGFRKGMPLVYTAWQEWLTDHIFELNGETGFYQKRICLIGLPRKNGKSLLGTSLSLDALKYNGTGEQIYSVAKNREQAKIVFEEAKNQVLRNPELFKDIKVYRDALENRHTKSFYKALSADGGSAQGLGPSLVIADELHTWESENGSERAKDLWAAVTEGSGDRPESMVVAITTAGANKNTILGENYDKGVKMAQGKSDDNDPYFGFYWWGLDGSLDIDDPINWGRANPNMALGLMSLDDMQAAYNKSKTNGFLSFKRYRLNQWVNLSGESFIPEKSWNDAYRDYQIPMGANIAVGFDGATKNDFTVIVIMEIETGAMEVYKYWEPDRSNPLWYIDRDEVVRVWDEIFTLYNVKRFFADDSYFENEITALYKKYGNVVNRVPQSASRMNPHANVFAANIYNKEITHSGDALLHTHVRNALLNPDGGYMKDRKNTNNKVDALVAAILANAGRVHENNQPKRRPLGARIK